MSKRWIVLCFGVVLGIAVMSSSAAYAAEGKKLAMEGTVFDLKASSSLTVYGYVSDKEFHPVSGAVVKAKPSKGNSETATSGASGAYSLYIVPGEKYTLSASKGKKKGKSVKLKVKESEDSDYIVNFQLK